MPTEIEFSSDAFPPYPGEEESINPGIWGKRLAEFIVSKLPEHNLQSSGFHAEDWGWEIKVKNKNLSVHIGCANQTDSATNYLCFIDPPDERVAAALQKTLESHPAIRDLSWR